MNQHESEPRITSSRWWLWLGLGMLVGPGLLLLLFAAIRIQVAKELSAPAPAMMVTDGEARPGIATSDRMSHETATEEPAPTVGEASDPSQSVQTHAYQVPGDPQDVAETVRSLFGNVAKVAVDRVGQSVIVVAPQSTLDRIATLIKEIDDRANILAAERRAVEAKDKERLEAQAMENQRHIKEAFEEAAAKDETDDELHRKEPRRTRMIKVPHRQPADVAKLLTDLFKDKAEIAVDEPTSSVLITINRAQTWAEVQFLLSEIEATATKLGATRADQSSADDHSAIVNTPPKTDLAESTLDQEARRLAAQYRSAMPEDQPALRRQLEELTGRHFDLRQSARKQEIDNLAIRLDSLRAIQQRRQQHKAEIVQRRIVELLDSQTDLKWDLTQGTAIPSQPIVDSTEPSTSSTSPDSLTAVPSKLTQPIENTFDGIPYSQWLRMLETERKPEKLASAIDACSRLCAAGDESRIIHGIFQAGHAFEPAPTKERDEVWGSGWAGLNRLAPAAVLDRLPIELGDGDSYPRGREFQMRFITQRCSPQIALLFNLNGGKLFDVLSNLVRQTSKKQEPVGWILAAACTIWHRTSIPQTDFEAIEPMVSRFIDDGLVVTKAGLEESACTEWKIVVKSVIARKPETPGLAQQLVKQATKSREIVELIGSLGQHAQPVVPSLIKIFTDEFHEYENWLRHDREYSNAELYRGHFRRCAIINALSEIGEQEQTAELLRELLLAAPDNRRSHDVTRELYEAVEKVSRKLAHVPIQTSGPLALGESTMINGLWHLESRFPREAAPNNFCEISSGAIFSTYFLNSDGTPIYDDQNESERIGERFELDLARPGTITFFDVDQQGRERPKTRREGRYELTRTTLRLQLAAVGQPRPTEMVKDKETLLEGQTLLEYERKPR